MEMTWNEPEAEALTLTASDEDVGLRVDVFAAQGGDLTRSVIGKLLESGAVTVNGARIAKNYRIRKGDVVEIMLPAPTPSEAIPQNIPLHIRNGTDQYNRYRRHCRPT